MLNRTPRPDFQAYYTFGSNMNYTLGSLNRGDFVSYACKGGDEGTEKYRGIVVEKSPFADGREGE